MAEAKSSVLIRPATKTDKVQWLPLYQGYQRFYESDLSDDPDIHLAVAELDGKLVGFTHYIEHKTLWSLKNSIYLQDLFVDPNTRNAGVGRALINFVYEEAKRLNIGKVHWLTHETNITAQHLYNKVGNKSGFIQFEKKID